MVNVSAGITTADDDYSTTHCPPRLGSRPSTFSYSSATPRAIPYVYTTRCGGERARCGDGGGAFSRDTTAKPQAQQEECASTTTARERWVLLD